MRLSIDNILSAHGLGGQPGPYFGNGSDGAFNPAGPPAPTTINGATLSYPYEGYFTATGNVYPSTANSSVTTPSIGLIFDGGSNTGPTVSPTPSASSSNIGSTGQAVGGEFSVSQTVYIKGFTYATNTAMSNVTFTIWDTTNQTSIATLTASSVPTGTNSYYLSSSVQLVGGRTYMLSLYGPAIYATAISTEPAPALSIPTYTYAPTSTYTFSTTLDGAPLVKNFTSVNIPANLTVNVSNRCQGMIWLVQGNVTISGIVSMDYMGALLDPTQNAGYAVAEKVYQLYYPLGNNKFVVIGPGGAGGAGGNGGASSTLQGTLGGLPTGGTWWGGGNGGGGGGGGASPSTSNSGGGGGNASYATASAGGAAVTTSSTTTASGKSGTAGGGGSGASAGTGTASATSGAGGVGLGGGGGGGGGASGTGTAGSGTNSTQAPGGLILIICGGNITINSGAVLSAKGGVGGNGGNALSGTNNSGFGGGGGGGAGGGIIALLYRGTYSNSGTTNVSGGAGGTGANSVGANWGVGQNGYAGLPGVVQTVKLT